ncbi:MAG TPA: hypothetical protein VGY75_06205 [Candidatus Udaeobacter sp.]|jgi:hypothetical protein|nr:hypothetical protein [Candidatus Udaeobacter sp.]
MKFHLLILSLIGVVATAAANDVRLDSHLAILRPLLDKTWKGTFTNSKPDQPVVDVQKWESALNGHAVRVVHSINNGAYGGETIFLWDEEHRTIAYYYFATEGFMTLGTLAEKEGKFVTHEDVKGDADGVTEVRGISEFLPDGKFHVRAEYLKKGQWTLGHEVTYEEAPDAKVVFK